MAGEKRIVHDAVPVGLRTAVEQLVDVMVSLAVERWEEEYEHAEHAPAYYQFEVRLVLEAREHVLAQRHGPYEIQAQQAAGDAEQNVGRHPFYRPRSIEVEREQRRRAAEDVCKACRGDAGYQYRQERSHGKVNHEHLEGEHEPRYGCLEYAGYGTGSTAANKQHERTVVHPEQLAQV